jgi:hypothetical protein
MVVLTACQPVRPTPAAAPVIVATPALAPDAAAIGAASVAFVAATRGIAPDALRITAVEAVNWPDAALGCPQPDMIYAAVITPGYRVVLETADARFVVHTDSRPGGEQIICPEE